MNRKLSNQQLIKHLPIVLMVILLIGLDRLTKWLAALYLSNPVEIIPYLSLRYEQNSGIAWSIPIPYQILVPVSILLLCLIPFFIIKELNLKHVAAQAALALLIAGGLGNVYDRIVYGYVVDFISVGMWPVFNFADSYLTIGIFIILLFYAKIKRT